jgi:lysophospholipase L1-like esterase
MNTSFLVLLCCIPLAAAAETVWHEAEALTVFGKGWPDTPGFNRFPARARTQVPGSVWGLSRHSAGLSLRLKTDASRIEVKWSVASSKLSLPHMPATGVSGIDIYRRADDGKWSYLRNGRPAGGNNRTSASTSARKGKMVELAIYLPLYNGTKSVSVGVPQGAAVEPAKQSARPIVIYGTSITQGACASRPGMAYTALLERRLDRQVINLGFSGSGKMDKGVVDLIAEIDASIFVIDCLWNMTGSKAKVIKGRVDYLVRTLREERPKTHIVLVGQSHHSPRHPTAGSMHQAEAFKALQQAGITGIHLVPGDDLIGKDGEGTVDGVHPNDLGMMRMAEALEPVLRPLLK